MEVDVVGLASEFPNDNPRLHHGVIWVCREPTGPVTAERPATERAATAGESATPGEPATADQAGVASSEDVVRARSTASVADEVEELDAILVEDLEPVEASVEGVPQESSPAIAFCDMPEIVVPTPLESSVLPPGPDDAFTVFVCTLADVAIGAGSPHVASLLPGLLLDGRLPESLEPDLIASLRAGGVLAGAEVSPAFVETTHAWRAILRGASDDFASCGATMLDEWAAELLAVLLVAPSQARALRQELRSRGVAAFGLASAAA